MSLGPTPQGTAIDPTWTWGSSAAFTLTFGGDFSTSQQLAQVTLPEPAVCSIYFQASASINDPALASVGTFSLNLTQGLGRVSVPRSIDFAGQPSFDSDLEFTIPFIPLHALQAEVQCIGDLSPGGSITIQVYLVLSPLTRIPQQQQKLKFGMALPGEADALDDELLENLEGDAPTVADIMGQEAQHRVQGDDGDDDGDDEPQAAPAWMMDLVDALTKRLGRAPNRQELRAAVERMRARQARRVR